MDKAIALLSGGIDSPVAIHLMHDRVDIIAIHFHQLPLTDKKEVDKVRELVKILKVQKTYLVPFASVLKHIVEKCQHRNYYIISKILMFRTAALLAQEGQAQFLLTGENLAQVSSQTLSNLTTITKNVPMEILRPVLTYNKQEIIDLARKIGTYEISKGPEICSLLGPPDPATRSDQAKIARELENVDFSLLSESLKKAEIVTLTP